MENERIDICGREFPANVVKEWSDINIDKEIGSGDFGKVYQGYLHLNNVQRYVMISRRLIVFLERENTNFDFNKDSIFI